MKRSGAERKIMVRAVHSETEYRESIGRMAEEAARQLREMAHPSASQRGKTLVKRLLHRPGAAADPIFWPAGLLMLGLSEAGRYEPAEEYLAPWLAGGMPVRHPDDAIAGTVLLRLYEQTGKQEYLEGAERIREYLHRCRRDAEGALVYGQRSGNDRIYADGTGQAAMFLSAIGEREQAGRQLSLFAARGLDERTGLPYHGYEASSGQCHGIIGWGRAVGWLLFGLASWAGARGAAAPLHGSPEESCAVRDGTSLLLPETERAVWQRLLGAVHEYRREDGLFAWQLECAKGPLDTSASGMIYYALQLLAEQDAAGSGLSSPFTGEELDLAAHSLLAQTDAGGRVLQSSAECVDFAQYVQQYGTYPWGQGAVLAFLAHRLQSKRSDNAGPF